MLKSLLGQPAVHLQYQSLGYNHNEPSALRGQVALEGVVSHSFFVPAGLSRLCGHPMEQTL